MAICRPASFFWRFSIYMAVPKVRTMEMLVAMTVISISFTMPPFVVIFWNFGILNFTFIGYLNFWLKFAVVNDVRTLAL